MEDVHSFWAMEGHNGEPKSWSTNELRLWLRQHTQPASDTLQQLDRKSLLQQVTVELDRQYAEYKPSFEFNYRNIDPSSLYLWTPEVSLDANGLNSLDAAKLGIRKAGRIEREFNSMFNLSETMMHIGQELPMGRSPQDDLRQDLLLAAQVYDKGNSSLLFQTYTQEEAITVNIRKAVLLLPQRKYAAGDKVILLRGNSDSSSSSSSSSVAPGSMGTVEDPTAAKPAGTSSKGEKTVAVKFEGQESVVQVPASQLLYVESRRPLSGDYVVLHGLQKQPQLCGRLARVQQMPAADSSEERCQVTLVPFLTSAAAGGVPQQQQQQNPQLIAPKLSSIALVQQPKAALLIAYSDHNSKTPAAMEAARKFMTSEQNAIMPLHNVRTTPREEAMLRRYLQTCQDILGSCSSGFKKQLLGQLNPKHWTLGLMVQIQRPLTDDEQQRIALRKDRKCRHCGKERSPEVTFKCCSLCGAVYYCSRDCQVADWKARHKSECRKDEQSTAAGDTANGSSSNGTGNSTSSNGASGSSVIVPLGEHQSGLFKGMHVSISGVNAVDTSKLPRNKYGDKEFLIKVMCRFGPGTIAQDVMIYDRLKSFFAQVPVGQAGHSEIVSVIRTVGRLGKMDPSGKAAYVRAKREGANLRVFVDQLPDQQQPW